MSYVHVIGIGGIGISALVQYYQAKGWRVTGSDASRSEITDDMERRGIPVMIGHRAENIKKPDLVVHVAALANDNPELVRARKLRIPVKSYPEAMGELTRKYDTVAVSGSHGKSTTTALIGLILARAGLDPTVIVGTKLREFGNSNFRRGNSNYLVIEADEWNKSFHYYHPKIAVITNVDKEHLDTYRTYAGVVKGFARYVKNVRHDGVVIANAKDKGVRSALRGHRGRIVWFNRRMPRYPLAIPGAHNQSNADAAWMTTKLLGVKKRVADAVFRSYRGAWRRMEKLTTNNLQPATSAIVYSDYAHHPTEIQATLAALRERHPRKHIVCVFEPHHADRLTQLFREFTRAFADADKLIFLPVYRVKGRDDEYKGKTSLDLAHAIRQPNVFFAPSYEVAFNMLGGDLLTDSVIVFMSAGTLDEAARRHFCVRSLS